MATYSTSQHKKLKEVDGVFFPFANISEALADPRERDRFDEKIIIKDGVPVTYWYRDGILDVNLITKDTSSISFSDEGTVVAQFIDDEWKLDLDWDGEISLNGNSGTEGQVLTSGGAGQSTTWSNIVNVEDDFADDTAAGIGGIGVGRLYHTSGTVKIRLI